MPVEVRPAGPDDWAAWRTLRIEALRDTPIGFLETVEAALARDEGSWRRRMGDVPCNALARARGDAVAMSSGFLIDGRPYLGAVYVTPAWRGRGLLARLVEPVVEWARAYGDELVLEVHEDNARARAAYTKLGFVETGATRPYPLDPARQELEMALPLPRT